MKKYIWVTVLMVKEKEDSEFETGIGIGNEVGVSDFHTIVVGGRVLQEVWNYYVDSTLGSFVVED